jgi:hypothetical protein
MKTKEKRQSRVIARGEVSGHAHIITGECEVKRNGNETVIIAKDNCVIKHLLEQPFVEEGTEVWTKEHKDIKIDKGEYRYVSQKEYDPYEKKINEVID